MSVACLGLGSNLGDRMAHLRAAVAALNDEDIGEVDRLGGVAALYETQPVGGPPGQPSYLNSAVRLRTLLPPRLLLDAVLRIEAALGRERRERWGPRVIDVDMLLYDDLVMDEPGLTVPHPRMVGRLFVLTPLADIAGEVVVPGSGRSVEELRFALAAGPEARGIRRVEGPGWYKPSGQARGKVDA